MRNLGASWRTLLLRCWRCTTRAAAWQQGSNACAISAIFTSCSTRTRHFGCTRTIISWCKQLLGRRPRPPTSGPDCEGTCEGALRCCHQRRGAEDQRVGSRAFGRWQDFCIPQRVVRGYMQSPWPRRRLSLDQAGRRRLSEHPVPIRHAFGIDGDLVGGGCSVRKSRGALAIRNVRSPLGGQGGLPQGSGSVRWGCGALGLRAEGRWRSSRTFDQ